MTFLLQNSFLTVSVSSMGAELLSVQSADGVEYIWQAKAPLWEEHAPLLFPICGRLFDGRYTYGGKTYELPIHGFARHEEFRLVHRTEDSLTLALRQNQATRAVYPFDFCLKVVYTLCGQELKLCATLENPGGEVLPATFGFHPGFCVPLGEGRFEDFYLEFDRPCTPRLFLLSPSCFLSGEQRPYPLERDRILPLRHDLFDHDALFFSDAASRVTLRSDRSERSVTVHYPTAPYVGFWQNPHTEAPFVCIEPWYGLPSVDGACEDFASRPHMTRLKPGETAEFILELSFR